MSWIEDITSAWKGHRVFAEWLVEMLEPTTIVELGVDYGYSSFVFANALLSLGKNGKVYGVDLFQGDIHTGFRNTHEFVCEQIVTHDLNTMNIIQGEFSQIADTWNLPIQILHIDGLHTYDAVKHDFECWERFVTTDGITLFHDVESFPEVGRFFKDLKNTHDAYIGYFQHSAGLGIYTKNKVLFHLIQSNYTPSFIVI